MGSTDMTLTDSWAVKEHERLKEGLGSLQRLQACSFLSASLSDTQVLSMEALSLHHTKWSVSPKICAANWAEASGERIVEQPRPAAGEKTKEGSITD